MKKAVNNTIEKITYQSGGQAICHREIYKHKDLKIMLELKSDSYRQQCYARASVLDGLNWNIIYTIPACEMATRDGILYAVPYRNNAPAAEKEFKADVDRLKKYVAELF
ncbi:hypothetical protein IJ425_03375 [bacterium]|nr:hypothetical protein [bacterium]